MSVDYQNYFSTCPEFNLSCSNTCASHKHCKLCVKSFDNDYKCRRHFMEAHLSRVVVINDQSCYPCKLTHDEPGCGRAHYHCPLCEKKVINRSRFIKHYEGHAKPQKINVNTTSSMPSIPEREVSEDEFGNSTEKEQPDEPKPKRQKSERKECPVCTKVMDVRSLPRHQREIHKEIYPTNVCVDEKRGLYMVRKSSHGGVAYPLHVQKCILSPSDIDTKRSPFCENDSCRVYMEVAWRSGMNAVECQHIREVGVNTVYKEQVELQENDLRDLSPDGRLKILKEERIGHCLSLAQAASADEAVLLVNFEDGDR